MSRDTLTLTHLTDQFEPVFTDLFGADQPGQPNNTLTINSPDNTLELT